MTLSRKRIHERITPKQQFLSSASCDNELFERTKAAFGRVVIARLNTLNLTRANLASALRMQHSVLSDILHGHQNLTFLTAVRIARALDMEFVPRLAVGAPAVPEQIS